MTVSDVGFTNAYAERYRDTVASEDRAWLSGRRELLSLADDRSGPLVVPGLLLPAYMNLDTAEAFGAYFDRLARGVSEPRAFLESYEPTLRRLGDDWLQVFDERWLAEGRGFEATLARLAEIYTRNYARFCGTVWPAELPGLWRWPTASTATSAGAMPSGAGNRGLSTRDIEDALHEIGDGRPLLGRVRPLLRPYLEAVRDAPDYETGRRVAHEVTSRFGGALFG